MATVTYKQGDGVLQNFVITKKKQNTLDVAEVEILPTSSPVIGDDIVVKDFSDVILFQGVLKNINQFGTKTLTVQDYGVLLQEKITNQAFLNQKPEQIINTVVTAAGLTYVSTIVSIDSIDKYVAKNKKSWDVVQDLVKLLDARFRVDASKNFHLELKQQVTSSEVINNTVAGLSDEWKEDASQLINEITVNGERLVQDKTENFAGPATEVTLTEIPETVRVTAGGSELEGFIEGTSSGDYEVDRENKKILFQASQSTIVVEYSWSQPVTVTRANEASVAKYGKSEDKVDRKYIQSRSEARLLAKTILSTFSEPFEFSTWQIADISKFNNFTVNETIFVEDNIRSKSGNFLIQKVEYDSKNGVFVTVGEEPSDAYDYNKEYTYRLEQLEEQNNNGEFVSIDRELNNTLKVEYTVEITDIVKRTFAADTFYLSENGSDPRSQMKNDGSGPVMREIGYTTTDLLTDNWVDESGNQMVDGAGNNLIF